MAVLFCVAQRDLLKPGCSSNYSEKNKYKKWRYAGDIRPFERNRGNLCRYFPAPQGNAHVQGSSNE
ncbi:hypothetical protein LMZ02_17085 [Paenibacillus macerans]|uniref:hypothetical protein n=1 Tax=Paenibacillus macerans TaxID=44252 RepID=UPI001F0E3AF9|nr:hypothetical protein [Paenibacillus macerans]UMV45247.1 hypothetical protein LMZ02_17085 [Paenibacillus macerans]